MTGDHLLATILGAIEGLTEFLPVSSTGHLILAGNSLGFTGPTAATFEIFIQLGAILAVVVLYFKRFLSLLDFNDTQRGGFVGMSGLVKLAVACAPAFFFGALLHKSIKVHLFAPLPVAIALLLGGLVLIYIERVIKPPAVHSIDEISLKQAFTIGLFQCLALWPGVSRSGSTIVGALICGISREAAAEFSFLVAVPVMCAATIFDLLKSFSSLSIADVPLFAIGFIVSFLSALLAIRVFISLLQKYSLAPFGYYRIALGIVVITMLVF